MILCGDVGATKTLLGLAARSADGRIEILVSQRYVAANVGSFDEALSRFLDDHRALLTAPLQASCFGVAGPVEGQSVRMTNLPWCLDARALSVRLGGIAVSLVNDFEAAASGIDLLEPGDLLTVQQGRPVARGPQLVIGAGSGLGVAFRYWHDDGDNGRGRYHVVTGEGGHIGFSPIDETQDGVMRRLRPRVGRVVAEHFVSGPGLANFYLCLHDDPVPTPKQYVATAANAEGLTGEEVYRRAIQEGDERALAAVSQFLRAYGVVAGDHALACLARGGVFLAGGIAQKFGSLMQDGRFLNGFGHKGPYADLVSTFPVQVVMRPDIGLLGAAVIAARLAP